MNAFSNTKPDELLDIKKFDSNPAKAISFFIRQLLSNYILENPEGDFVHDCSLLISRSVPFRWSQLSSYKPDFSGYSSNFISREILFNFFDMVELQCNTFKDISTKNVVLFESNFFINEYVVFDNCPIWIISTGAVLKTLSIDSKAVKSSSLN